MLLDLALRLGTLGATGDDLAAACAIGLLAEWKDTWLDDATVQDDAASGTHVAIPPVSIYLDGSSYGTLGTAITSVGDFEHDFVFRIDAIGSVEVLFGGADSTEGYFGVDASGNPFVYIGAALDTYTDFTLVADTTYTCKLKRVTTTTTLTVNGTSQAHTTLTSDFVVEFFGGYGTGTTSPFSGNQWNHVIKNASSVEVLNNYLASGASSTVSPGMVGPDITWTGLTVPGDWTIDDPRFGHTYNLTSYVIADGTGTYSIGSYLPASYTSEGTLYTGTAQQNLDVDGFAGVFDGSTYATVATTVASSGDFKYTFIGKLSSTPAGYTFIRKGDNSTTVTTNADGRLIAKLGGTSYTGTGLVQFGVDYVLTIQRVVDQLTMAFNSSTQTVTMHQNSVGFDTISRAAALQYIGSLSLVSVEHGGVLVNNWIPQSSNTSTGTTIYDTVGGNHATLTGATTPFFTAAIDESWLAQWGGAQVENILTDSERYDVQYVAIASQDTYTENVNVDANTDYIYEFDIAIESVAAPEVIREYIYVIPPVGSTVTYYVDGVEVAAGYMPVVGIYTFKALLSVSSTSGLTSFRAGAGCLTSLTATLTLNNTRLYINTESSYIQTTATAIPLSIVPGTTGTTDALGNTKGFVDYKDTNLPGAAVNATLPATPEMYEMASGLFTAGVPDATDLSAIVDGAENEIRKSDIAILGTHPAQTGLEVGGCRKQTNDFLQIVE